MKSGEVYGIIINGRIEPSGGMTTNNYDRVYNKEPEQSIFSGILNRYKPELCTSASHREKSEYF
jgi:hypothetical protein